MKTTLCSSLTLLTFILLAFVVNSFAQGNTSPERMVRVVYFLPNDRRPQPDIDAKLDTLIKDVQQLYADEMERHGFGRKTFRIEIDGNGKALVHHVRGRFNDAYYQKYTSRKAHEDTKERFDQSKNIYLYAIDISTGLIGYDDAGGVSCGQGHDNAGGGYGIIPASGDCIVGDFGRSLVAHELGHAFGLSHYFRNDAYVMSYGRYQNELSPCHAEWLNAHRYFNSGQTPTYNTETAIKMTSSGASPPNTIRLQFEITDPDGLHQALLLAQVTDEDPGYPSVLDCKSLSGESNIIEFVTSELAEGPASEVWLHVIDGHGYFTRERIEIDIASLLPQGKVVSIPDANLAAAIRETLGLRPRSAITQRDMLRLTRLEAPKRQITNLTGLEHAVHLRYLDLWENQIRDITPLTGLTRLKRINIWNNQISSIPSLAGLTDLTDLDISSNSINDITPFAELTQLKGLSLGGNDITDISALAGLTQLQNLWLWSNRISAVTVLARLTKLRGLHLHGNPISDITPLTRLTELEHLDLAGMQISEISPLAGLSNLTFLRLSSNNISDISSLVANTELREWETVFLRGNPLGYQSIHTHIPTLQDRGIKVQFDSRTPTPPLKISGDNQQGAPGTILEHPLVVVVRDRNGAAYAEVPVVFTVAEGGGTLSITSTMTAPNGRAESTLTLGPNAGTNTVSVSVAGIQGKQAFTAQGIRTPKTLEIISGKDQEGLPGEALANPFVVEVRDQFDNPFSGARVTFAVTSGGGRLSVTTATTDSNGRAESTLTLGTNPGTNTVTVSVTGIQEKQTFNAEAIRIPETLDIVSGNDQEGLPGAALENPFVVEVRDRSDKPLPGVQVTFSVTSGGGTLSATSVRTNSNGRAESRLTLGPNPGANTVTVSVTGIQAQQTFNAEGIRIPLAFWIISGDKQQGLPGEALANPFVVEVRDRFDNPFSGAQVTFAVTSGGGRLSVSTATTDSDGRAESTLTLGPNPGANTVTVSVTGIQAQQTFNAEGIRIPLAFWIISGFDQKGVIGEALPKPIVVEMRDQSGEPLPGAQVTFAVTSGGGTLSVTSTTTDSDGRAESILTLGPDPGTNTVEVAVTGIQGKQTVTAIAELPPIPQDVNRDDVVNILDLVFVASALGDEGQGLVADVNGDGVVNILDLVSVAGALGDVAAAPAADPQALAMLTATDVGRWLGQAQGLDLMDATSQRGVLFLEQLLAALTPKETALLPNYPNPFNPETWIPYRLAEDAGVTLTIYDTNGALVRRLDVGHRSAGFYESRSQAIYWDGRNDFGEGVVSGVYFYHLSAGDYSATRKMLVVK